MFLEKGLTSDFVSVVCLEETSNSISSYLFLAFL